MYDYERKKVCGHCNGHKRISSGCEISSHLSQWMEFAANGGKAEDFCDGCKKNDHSKECDHCDENGLVGKNSLVD